MAAPGKAPSPSPASPPVSADDLATLARTWAALGPADTPALQLRLTTVLRRLAIVLRTEPFFPRGARAIGAELPATGLCGDPADLPPDAADVLPATLRLLRECLPAVLRLSEQAADGPLRAALDELAGGFAHALADLARPVPLDTAASTLGAGTGTALRARHLDDFYEQTGVGIAIVGLDGHVLEANPALVTMLGLQGALDEPRPFSDLVHPEDLADVAERYHRIVRGDPPTMRLDLRVIRPDVARVVWVYLIASLVRHPDGRPSHITIVVEDVSARRELRAQLPATRDSLTHLPGASVVEHWMRRAYAGSIARVGVCALDIDGFQAVNDARGEDVGDRLLLAVAGRLQLAAGDHVVARSGGDEFMVLVADPENVAEVCRVADRLQGALAAPFLIGGRQLSVSASVGVSESATAGTAPDELVRAAEVARSWAKALGGGRRVVYDHRRDSAEAARYALLAGLPRGIANGEFELAYQPLVALHDRRVLGAEALVRWRHPVHGTIGPARFIPLAEHTGMIVELGRWILRAACQQAARWQRELGAATPYVSVNVSPVQLADPGWVPEVAAALADAALPPRLLQLEITEQAVLGEGAGTLDGLAALRDAGVRLALDDFGTGWSSLAWLRRLPVHTLKIDGSFIDGLRHPVADPVDASIVGALIGMAHALDLEVTAEWVETGVQARRLAVLGCDTGQGRWFGDAGPGEWVPRLARRTIDP